jgi:hypothetical protein
MLAFVLAGAFALGGCAASLAASAVGAAIQASQGQPRAIANLREAAAEACRAHAARYGEPRIIDVNLRGPGKAVVWGTVEAGTGRQSFECRYAGKIAGFKLRPIRPRRGGSAD